MHHKSKLGSGKKAYLQIDFAFAILIFTFFILTTYSYYKSHEAAQLNAIEYSKLEADARDICYLLTQSSGSPQNWEDSFSATEFYGFKNQSSHNLSSTKMTVFNSSNYFTVIDAMGLEGYFLKVHVEGVKTNSTYLNFGTTGGFDSYVGTYSCYGKYNGEIAKVYVEVWR